MILYCIYMENVERTNNADAAIKIKKAERYDREQVFYDQVVLGIEKTRKETEKIR